MKKLISILVCLLSVFALILPAYAAEKEDKKGEAEDKEVTKEPFVIYMFSREQCPHCLEAAEYFETLQGDKKFAGKFTFKEYEVFDPSWKVKDKRAHKLLEAVAEKYGDDINNEKWGTPYIIIGDKSFTGYAASMNAELEKQINSTYEDENYVDQVANIVIPEEEDNDTANTIVFIAILAVVIIGGTFLVVWSRKND